MGMSVKVVEISTSEQLPSTVGILTSYGSVTGVWIDRDPPQLGDYNAEFGLTDIFTYGKNMIVSPLNTYRIKMAGEEIIFTGEIEHIYEDGTVFFGLGEGSMLITTSGPLPSVGTFVELRACRLEIYDQHL
jgi:hypothetical protein